MIGRVAVHAREAITRPCRRVEGGGAWTHTKTTTGPPGTARNGIAPPSYRRPRLHAPTVGRSPDQELRSICMVQDRLRDGFLSHQKDATEKSGRTPPRQQPQEETHCSAAAPQQLAGPSRSRVCLLQEEFSADLQELGGRNMPECRTYIEQQRRLTSCCPRGIWAETGSGRAHAPRGACCPSRPDCQSLGVACARARKLMCARSNSQYWRRGTCNSRLRNESPS